MSAEDERDEEMNETQDGQSTADDDGSDLADALATGDEASFISAEKKPMNRTTVMVFGALLLGAAGYYFMYARTGPQSAAAAATPEAEKANQTINQFLSAGNDNIRVMQQLRQTTDKVVAQFRSSAVAQVPVTELQANPFKYAQMTDDATAAAAAKKKHDEERQAALKSVQELQLQTVMHSGTTSTCMINNKMYKEGQEVAGFTVEKISTNAVIVRTGAFRFELKMQR